MDMLLLSTAHPHTTIHITRRILTQSLTHSQTPMTQLATHATGAIVFSTPHRDSRSQMSQRDFSRNMPDKELLALYDQDLLMLHMRQPPYKPQWHLAHAF